MHRKINIINALLNVKSNEWPSVITAWLLRFFYYFGFIMGWTILTALFVSRFGIESLPYLYIFNAALVMLSTFHFAKLVRFFSSSELINFSLLFGAILLFIAAFLNNISDTLFVATILLANSIFLAQLEIFIFSFTEELFTPIEGERLFPIVESGELMGGIIGGLAVTILSQIFPPHKIIFFWIFSLLLIASIIYFLPHSANSLPRISRRQTHTNKASKELLKTTQYIRKTSFLSKLAIIVGLFWMLFYLIQFQFTYFVTESTLSTLKPGQSFEAALTSNLGSLEAILHTTGFIVQFFVAGRIISSLGTIKSLVIQPILAIISAIGVLIFPGFITALIARNNLEIGRSTHLNAYHNTFYAIGHSRRNQIREYLEGYIRQIGIIIGMIGLIIIQKAVFQDTSFQLNLGILIISLTSIYIVIKSKTAYTSYARSHFKDHTSPETKKSAINILLQNGHSSEYNQVFIKDLTELISKPEPDEVKTEALKVLGKFHHPKSLSAVINCIASSSRDVRSAAVHSLQKFPPNQIKSESYSKITDHLIQLCKSDTDRDVRVAAFRALSKLNKPATKNLISHSLTPDNPHLADYLYAASFLKSKSLIPKIEPFIHSHSLSIRANALITLWHHPHLRPTLTPILNQILNPQNYEQTLTMIHVLSKIQHPRAKEILVHFLTSPNPKYRKHALFALAKKHEKEAINPLAAILADPSAPAHKEAKRLTNTLPPKLQRKIYSAMHSHLSTKVRDIITSSQVKFLEDMPFEQLLELKHAYAAINDHQALMDIEHIIHQQQHNA